MKLVLLFSCFLPFLLISCGGDSNLGQGYVYENNYQLCTDGRAVNSGVYKDLNHYSDKISQLISSDLISEPVTIGRYSPTFSNPFIFSESVMREKLNQLEKSSLRISEEFSSWLKSDLSQTVFNFNQEGISGSQVRQKVTQFSRRLKRIQVKAKRWVLLDCNKKKEKRINDKNYIPYLKLKKSVCHTNFRMNSFYSKKISKCFSEFFLKRNHSNKILSVKIEKQFLRFCSILFPKKLNRKKRCEQEFKFLKNRKLLDKEIENKISRYEREFMKTFEINPSLPQKLQCQKNRGTFILKLPVNFSNKDDEGFIRSSINRFWNIYPQYFRIDPYHSVEKTAVRLNEQNLGISFVLSNRPNEINLSRNSKNKKQVFAHELGHVLGFRDCYFEFYNKKRDEFKYYELDSSNLMCSVEYGANVKRSYIKKIINQYCTD